MLSNLLSVLFPPSTQSLGRCSVQDSAEFDEQGWAGNVQEKPYRDGIHRVTVEGE
jgi:hypothetical protein